MKLTDLNPRWFERDGQRVGLIFHCPHCIAAGRKPPVDGEEWHPGRHVTLLTCFFAPTPKREQFRLIGAHGGTLDEDGWPAAHIVTCNPTQRWTIEAGAEFADLTLAPSLDSSASGHWHGFIRGGGIVTC